jgi:hypothetical protein
MQVAYGGAPGTLAFFLGKLGALFLKLFFSSGTVLNK